MIRRVKHHRHVNQEERWREENRQREKINREREKGKLNTHIHTHTQREREREKERGKVEDTETTLYHKDEGTCSHIVSPSISSHCCGPIGVCLHRCCSTICISCQCEWKWKCEYVREGRGECVREREKEWEWGRKQESVKSLEYMSAYDQYDDRAGQAVLSPVLPCSDGRAPPLAWPPYPPPMGCPAAAL